MLGCRDWLDNAALHGARQICAWLEPETLKTASCYHADKKGNNKNLTTLTIYTGFPFGFCATTSVGLFFRFSSCSTDLQSIFRSYRFLRRLGTRSTDWQSFRVGGRE